MKLNTKPLIHYIVRHSKIVDLGSNNLGYEFFENIFIEDSPILARKKALEYYDDYTHGMDQRSELSRYEKENSGLNDDIGSNSYIYDGQQLSTETEKTDVGGFLSREMQESLNSLNLDDTFLKFQLWESQNPELKDKVTPAERPAVILLKDDSLLNDEHDSKEIMIQYHVNVDDPYGISELMANLDEEFKIYKEANLDTTSEVANIPFWDPEVFYEGAVGELIFGKHQILRTDFDWSQYSEANWWNDPDFEDQYIEGIFPVTLEEEIKHLINPKVKKRRTDQERIQSGEGHKIEFKPDLLGYDIVNKRSFKFEAAKTICAFLNSKGGNLYIGVKDDSKITGVDLKKKSEDEFLRAFTSEVVNFFFERGISDSNIKGELVTLENKKVFRVKVRGSHKPVFLLRKDQERPIPLEFYIRREASTQLLYNPKHMLEYVESHWWAKKYKKK